MEWISVKDCLPRDVPFPQGRILFVWADGDPEVAKFVDGEWYTHNSANWSEPVYGEVTHWFEPTDPSKTETSE